MLIGIISVYILEEAWEAVIQASQGISLNGSPVQLDLKTIHEFIWINISM